jgi:hypothetical protein
MSFSLPIQWFHSHEDPDGTFNTMHYAGLAVWADPGAIGAVGLAPWQGTTQVQTYLQPMAIRFLSMHRNKDDMYEFTSNMSPYTVYVYTLYSSVCFL